MSRTVARDLMGMELLLGYFAESDNQTQRGVRHYVTELANGIETFRKFAGLAKYDPTPDTVAEASHQRKLLKKTTQQLHDVINVISALETDRARTVLDGAKRALSDFPAPGAAPSTISAPCVVVPPVPFASQRCFSAGDVRPIGEEFGGNWPSPHSSNWVAEPDLGVPIATSSRTVILSGPSTSPPRKVGSTSSRGSLASQKRHAMEASKIAEQKSRLEIEKLKAEWASEKRQMQLEMESKERQLRLEMEKREKRFKLELETKERQLRLEMEAKELARKEKENEKRRLNAEEDDREHDFDGLETVVETPHGAQLLPIGPPTVPAESAQKTPTPPPVRVPTPQQQQPPRRKYPDEDLADFQVPIDDEEEAPNLARPEVARTAEPSMPKVRQLSPIRPVVEQDDPAIVPSRESLRPTTPPTKPPTTQAKEEATLIKGEPPPMKMMTKLEMIIFSAEKVRLGIWQSQNSLFGRVLISAEFKRLKICCLSTEKKRSGKFEFRFAVLLVFSTWKFKKGEIHSKFRRLMPGWPPPSF